MATTEKIWNGMLSAWTVDGYSSVVNFDIVAPSYSWYWQKQRNTSFYYKKRKPYWSLNDPIDRIYKGYDFSDVMRINESSCNEEDLTEYIMLTDRENSQMKILTQIDWTIRDLCWGNGLNANDCAECFCDCGYDKFIRTDFVKWTRLRLDGSFAWLRWVQFNDANGTIGMFKDDDITNTQVISVGNWIYAYSRDILNTPGATGAFWQARQIIKINNLTNGKTEFVLNAPWDDLDLDTQEGTGVMYHIYPERGEVVMYATCQWLKVIHSLHSKRQLNGAVVEDYVADITTAETSFMWDTCIYSVNDFNKKINLLGSNGYNMSGWDAWNKLYFSVNNLNYVGWDKLSQVVFRNFLVQFGKENISIIVNNAEWISFNYKLDASIGIFSRTSFVTHQNSLYILGSDKRLYSVDISSNGANGYMLNLTDQSLQIKWDLELLNIWDEVNMSADGTHLYIFINNKTSRENSNNTKTRILKYYRDYNKRVRHDLCCGVIQRKKYNYYLGDSWYTQSDMPGNAGMKDCWEFYIDAYIEAFIWENEDDQTEFTTLAYKKLRWMKVLLGKGIYTDGSTKFIIDYGSHWYKQQYQIDKVEHIDWINKNNLLSQWEITTPDDCALEVLAECTNVVRPCSWQPIANEEVVVEWMGNVPMKYLDNCMCLDERAYEMSDVYNVMLKLDHLKKSELFRIKIMSTGWDEMVFGGLAIGLEAYDIATHDVDNADVINDWSDCCIEGTYIDENNPCLC